jgi:hypothetical protein
MAPPLLSGLFELLNLTEFKLWQCSKFNGDTTEK